MVKSERQGCARDGSGWITGLLLSISSQLSMYGHHIHVLEWMQWEHLHYRNWQTL